MRASRLAASRSRASARRLPIAFDEGTRYQVAGIKVDGADVLGVEKVRTATGVAVDAPWQAAFLGQARTGVEAAYHNSGFADTEVYVEPQVDKEQRRVTLYVAVAEGQRQVLQDLTIEGNRTTTTKTVSDLVHLRFGDPVTPALISDVQKRLYDVGVFRRVTVDFTPTPGGSRATGPHDDPMIAKVTVLEAPRFSLTYGLQVSRTIEATGTEAEYKPGAAVDFRDRNFLGKAMGLGLGVRGDSRRTERAEHGDDAADLRHRHPIVSSSSSAPTNGTFRRWGSKPRTTRRASRPSSGGGGIRGSSSRGASPTTTGA